MFKLAEMLCGALISLMLLIMPASAGDITFLPTTQLLQNPERGFWRFAADDFAKATSGDLDDIRDSGMTLGYAIVRLDSFRDRKLPVAYLTKLRAAFGRARTAGIKVILRFAYNYPQSSSDFLNAKDAPLSIVLTHIEQLKPVIASNRDVIAVWQAGFIGAWGEGHTSSHHLDTPANKAKIRDALLAALPADRMLQWRYPPDIMRWSPVPPAAGALGRIGIHNDCFLSSNTDVGTYSENAAVRARQRAYAAKLSAATYFSGETCDAEPSHIRSDCGSILREGAQFHLAALGRDYFIAFHKRWKKEGCFDDVDRLMGYRLQLERIRAPDTIIAGQAIRIDISIRNVGWARLTNPRKLVVSLVNRTTGAVFNLKSGDLRSIEPDEAGPDVLKVSGRIPVGLVAGDYRIELSAPDEFSSLAKDLRYSIRFANADDPAKNQGFQTQSGRFRTGLTVKITRPN